MLIVKTRDLTVKIEKYTKYSCAKLYSIRWKKMLLWYVTLYFEWEKSLSSRPRHSMRMALYFVYSICQILQMPAKAKPYFIIPYISYFFLCNLVFFLFFCLHFRKTLSYHSSHSQVHCYLRRGRSPRHKAQRGARFRPRFKWGLAGCMRCAPQSLRRLRRYNV